MGDVIEDMMYRLVSRWRFIEPSAEVRRSDVAAHRPIYEFRRYTACPGKMTALQARFENVTRHMWKRHGIKCVGFWESLVGDSNQLTYLLEWQDMAHRERVWEAYQSDPEWQAARAASEKDGPIVAAVHNELWRPTRFSPITSAVEN